MICFSPVRFDKKLMFRALALHRSRLRDCGDRKSALSAVGANKKRFTANTYKHRSLTITSFGKS